MSFLARGPFRRMFTTSARLRMGGEAAGHEDHDYWIKFWKNVCIFAVIPALGLSLVNAHYPREGEIHRPEFVPYDHLRIRTKKFPWGDGNHSLFHNPHVNALPDGYEDEH